MKALGSVSGPASLDFECAGVRSLLDLLESAAQEVHSGRCSKNQVKESMPYGHHNSNLLRQQLGVEAALHVMHVQGSSNQVCMCKLACFTGRRSAMSML